LLAAVQNKRHGKAKAQRLMNCPDCGGASRVLETTGTRRRRECLKCRSRWTTEEVTQERAKKLAIAEKYAEIFKRNAPD
jgi:transcriptional regulator NrdR family protein